MREPMNASSDFFFIAVTLYYIRFALFDSKHSKAKLNNPKTNLIESLPTLSWVGALFNLIHFFGTFLNHASRCYIFHRLDVCGMWLAIWYWSFYFSAHNYLWWKNELQNPKSKQKIAFYFKSN